MRDQAYPFFVDFVRFCRAGSRSGADFVDGAQSRSCRTQASLRSATQDAGSGTNAGRIGAIIFHQR